MVATKKRKTAHERFQRFHADNPQVYTLFKRFAREARDKVKRYSADAILHRIRWHVSVETRGDEFKVNNDWAAYYARLLIAEDASYVAFFELRKIRETKPAEGT
jgi:hypothetical protein